MYQGLGFMSKDRGRSRGIEIGKEEGEILRGENIIKMEEEGMSQEVGQGLRVDIGRSQEDQEISQGREDHSLEVLGEKVRERVIREKVLGERVQAEEVQEESIGEKDIEVSREKGKEKCTACKCDNCKKRKEIADELSVNWCEMEDKNVEYMVNYVVGGKREMVLDIGAPVSLVGKEWAEKYAEENGVSLEDLRSQECEQAFRFGPTNRYESRKMIELPVKMRAINKIEDLWVWAYVIDAEVPLLVGRKTLEGWKSKLNTTNKILETDMGGVINRFIVVNTGGKHFGI